MATNIRYGMLLVGATVELVEGIVALAQSRVCGSLTAGWSEKSILHIRSTGVRLQVHLFHARFGNVGVNLSG